MKLHFSVFIKDSKRVDMYLSALFSDFSRSYIQKIIDNGQLKINWKELKKNKKISLWDVVEIEIIIKDSKVEPENLPLDIIFENWDFAVINKDPFLNTHPVPWEWWNSNTLVNAILYHIKDIWSIGWTKRPGIVHRLDKNTSGLILVAKNDSSMKELQEIIKLRKINKYYIAIVNWIFKEKNFKIQWDIWRDPNNRIKMTAKWWLNVKNALTFWEVLWYIEDKYTVLKVKIETWRTHQIRVHLSSIWYPIIWDEVYWKDKINKEALENFNSAENINPNNYLIYYNRGLLHKLSGNYNSAVIDFEKCISIHPDFIPAKHYKEKLEKQIQN